MLANLLERPPLRQILLYSFRELVLLRLLAESSLGRYGPTRSIFGAGGVGSGRKIEWIDGVSSSYLDGKPIIC